MNNEITEEQQGKLAPAEAAYIERPAAEFDITLKVGTKSLTLPVQVFGAWHRGFPGSRETPPEPRYCDVRRVTMDDIDISDWLSIDPLAELIYGELYNR